MFYFLDLFGTAVFALSGMLAAREKNLDWYGGLVLALVTAIGGGTFRDLVLGKTPVFWVNNYHYIWVALLAALLTLPFINRLAVNRWLIWSDAFGLGLFTVIGAQVAMDLQQAATVAVIMGVVTGTFGGMIRDVLCGRVPLVLKQEIYATASALGAVVYFVVASHLNQPLIGTLCCITIVTGLRIMAAEYGWRLPKLG